MTAEQVVLPEEQRIPVVKTSLIFEALMELVLFDSIRSLFRFGRLKRWGTPECRHQRRIADVANIVSAVDLACVWYPVTVKCLQRSAVAARMLRLRGIDARLVIGVQQLPFRSHAWVEVIDCPVNERKRVRDVYTVLECWGGV